VSSENPLTKPCPQCGKPLDHSDPGKYGPFCSYRCQLLDLGAWVSEEQRIPGENDLLMDSEGDFDQHFHDGPQNETCH